jgi:nucleoside-diphosphate-sugar epimerase
LTKQFEVSALHFGSLDEPEDHSNKFLTGVKSIVHTASPLNLTLKLRGETITPAVEGTLGLLKSAYNSAGSQLNNIVVTGSVASVMGITPVPGKVYTEEDFDTETEKLAEEAGGDPSTNLLYYTSKILAEKALWRFVKEFKVSTFKY